MKKTSLLALALCAGWAAFAQNNEPQLRTPMAVKTRVGIRAGVNLADLTAKNLPSTTGYTEAQSKTSFHGGVFVNVPLAGMFRFQPEVDFSSQGGKVQGASGTTNNPTFEQDLHYINVPLNFQLMTSKGFFVQTGPQLGYLIEGKRKSTSSSSTAEVDNKKDFDKLDFSWSGGVGYLTRFGLGIDLRYNIGIANIVSDDATGTQYKGGTWKNSVGQFALIYHFGASK